jgi:hypothetical protein
MAVEKKLFSIRSFDEKDMIDLDLFESVNMFNQTFGNDFTVAEILEVYPNSPQMVINGLFHRILTDEASDPNIDWSLIEATHPDYESIIHKIVYLAGHAFFYKLFPIVKRRIFWILRKLLQRDTDHRHPSLNTAIIFLTRQVKGGSDHVENMSLVHDVLELIENNL